MAGAPRPRPVLDRPCGTRRTRRPRSAPGAKSSSDTEATARPNASSRKVGPAARGGCACTLGPAPADSRRWTSSAPPGAAGAPGDRALPDRPLVHGQLQVLHLHPGRRPATGLEVDHNHAPGVVQLDAVQASSQEDGAGADLDLDPERCLRRDQLTPPLLAMPDQEPLDRRARLLPLLVGLPPGSELQLPPHRVDRDHRRVRVWIQLAGRDAVGHRVDHAAEAQSRAASGVGVDLVLEEPAQRAADQTLE